MTPAIFGLSGTVLAADERAFFAEADPVGYILFGRNCESREQLRALTDELRAIHGRDRLIVSIDQEGGRVRRMKPPVWLEHPPAGAYAALYDIAPISAIEAAWVGAELIGRELAEVGITVDYHPPLDLPQPSAHDVIGDRALGSEAKQVAALGRAVLNGLASAGVVGCIKHMPGHGRSTADTHKEMPTVTASEAELESDLQPFRSLRDAPLGMTGHLLFTAWDAANPATLSHTVIGDIIRTRIGFDGLLLTDDIDMEALSGSVPERSERAIVAGCDVALNCWAKMDDMVGIVERCGMLSEAGQRRLDRVHAAMGAPGEGLAIEELLAKREALLAIAAEARMNEGGLLLAAAEAEADSWDGIAAPTPGDDSALYLSLDGWEGPLDLLLDLARRQKVDLRAISILALVDQYLGYMERAEALRLELAADYLVMAAWLAYLKSALLLPREAQEEPSAAELALRLQVRLARLGAMREAAARLMARDRLGRDVFARGAPEGLETLRRTGWRCDQFALIEAYGRVRARTAPVVHMVRERPVMTLDSALSRVSAMLGVALDWMRLEEFLPPHADAQLRRSALASSFVAALELARLGKAELAQDEAFGPLRLRRAQGASG